MIIAQFIRTDKHDICNCIVCGKKVIMSKGAMKKGVPMMCSPKCGNWYKKIILAESAVEGKKE